MITRLLLATAALSLTLSTAAEALPVLISPLAARTGPDRSSWVEPPPRNPAPAASGTGAAIVEKRDSLAAASPAPDTATTEASKTVSPGAAPAPAKAEARVRPIRRAAPIRSARYTGSDGGVRRVGRAAYAFSGSFGGCRIHGHAGPGGFTIDRAC